MTGRRRAGSVVRVPRRVGPGGSRPIGEPPGPRLAATPGLGTCVHGLESLVREMFFEGYSVRGGLEAGSAYGGERRLDEPRLLDPDPAVDGFGAVFAELYAVEREGVPAGFEVGQTAATTANRPLVFSTGAEVLARFVYAGEVGPRSLALACGGDPS